eukprot:TRINITY_DN9940_c0_g1_i1.p1 TRINITY_DN9940_c0_g1~~TRINITY_DN9940_c0_g1_i1.p1  ORF type:complete len:348 (+),score=86.81 TRINITY_DN9940_c0_g1_i1:89-1045(+)
MDEIKRPAFDPFDDLRELTQTDFEEFEFEDAPAQFTDPNSLFTDKLGQGGWKRGASQKREGGTAVHVMDDDGETSEIGKKLFSFTQAPKAFLDKMKLSTESHYSVVFLITLGILSASVSVSMDIAIFNLRLAHRLWMHLGTSLVAQYFLWISFSITVLLTGVGITKFLAPQAAGSGIPEMKCIISGSLLKGVLAPKAMITKALGITMALGSGMILGKEGPFIHLTCIMANQLARLPVFHMIRTNEQLLQVVIGAACATGVAAHFGAPVGGVLFSIEVTSSYYPTRNYFYAFVGQRQQQLDGDIYGILISEHRDFYRIF